MSGFAQLKFKSFYEYYVWWELNKSATAKHPRVIYPEGGSSVIYRDFESNEEIILPPTDGTAWCKRAPTSLEEALSKEALIADGLLFDGIEKVIAERAQPYIDQDAKASAAARDAAAQKTRQQAIANKAQN